MKIHPIQTGTVVIKQSQRIGRGRALPRAWHVLFDSTWTEPLPIYAWAIESSEGVIVVDTGETARTRESGYFPAWHPYFRLAVRVEVSPEQEIGPGLRRLGIAPEDVRMVILTHMHTDHAGGLDHFPKSEILISPLEYSSARGVAGRLRGYLPNRWPRGFAPRPIEFAPTPLGPFDQSYSVTRDRCVRIVPTPGHTPGHLSVVAVDGNLSYFLAGDATYTQQALIEQAIDGVSPFPDVAAETLGLILAFARSRPTVYLPTHDPASAQRLEQKQTLAHGAMA